ncbi:cytochrome P450 [Rudaeicoccus suwonensis]|uniref:Unspecific monooxygenase n=1 Tax=Rudaeicoccus suwonensis TaxID=657409 RepID=A0A561ECE3_9MICO|nr:cytochrome P450 [Rudaeicoccus suwonensis]TWE13285.1 unspecific monooxygenase [Rudaeicoccus suwonensis]
MPTATRRPPANWPHHDFPHPKGRRPFVNDAPTMLRGNDRRPLQRAVAVTAGLGPIFEIKLFGQKLVFVRDAALAAELCDESRFEKKLAPGVAALREVAGDGLFTAYSDEPNWQLAHDLLRPAFTRAAMQGYHSTMLQVAGELIDHLDRATEPVDVSPALTKLTLETIGRTSFSKDFGSFTKTELDPFVAAMVRSLKRGQQRGALAALPFASLLLRRGKEEYAAGRAYIDSMIDDIIDQRLAGNDAGGQDLLGLMLHSADEASGAKLDRLNIRYQILTFLVAGHETTSGALSFAMYYLATQPAVRAAAAAETDAILGDDPDAEPSFEQVAKFRYLRRVLDESLRLWPTAPGFARGPRQETVIGGKYRMTPSDWCIVMASEVHRDPKVWGDDALEFDPDRFLPAAIKARPAHTYLPFGTGERACIGRQFALHEAVLVLARLCHRYDFEADPDYELTISERLTLMPEGFRLSFTPRR